MTKRQTVLIVEDDEWLAEQHARTLQAANYKVNFAAHALAAIDAVDDARPDVIVLDVLLTGPNAFVLLHELQSHTDLCSIPVILCTNSAESITSEDSRSYGIRQILDKSTMVPEDLVAAIKKVLL